jgi:hypothetical protein
VGTNCLYVGSTSPFRGLGVNVVGSSAGRANLQWSYWNGAWANLETTPFMDGTYQLLYSGFVHWSDDTTGWVTTSVNGSPLLYYVRGCLASGSYTTPPLGPSCDHERIGRQPAPR